MSHLSPAAQIVQEETDRICALLLERGPMAPADIALALGMKHIVIRRRLMNSGPNCIDPRLVRFACKDGIWSVTLQWRHEHAAQYARTREEGQSP